MFDPKIYSSKDICQNIENVPKTQSWNIEITEKMSVLMFFLTKYTNLLYLKFDFEQKSKHVFFGKKKR